MNAATHDKNRETLSTANARDITQHPDRFELTNELHARPFQALQAPCDIFHFAKYSGQGKEQADREHLRQYCIQFGVNPPMEDGKHFSADFGTFRLRWERHSEFTSYTLIIKNPTDQAFSGKSPGGVVDWINKAEGELLVATHLSILSRTAGEPDESWLKQHFTRNSLVTAEIASGEAQAWTDLRIQSDGYNRILLKDRALTQMKMGRVAQRLLEIATYRNMALMSLSLARQISPRMSELDNELSSLLGRMLAGAGAEGELNSEAIEEDSALLKELSRLSSEIEGISSRTAYRFNASKAYYALVQSRIEELNEARVPGFQTIGEFLDRRMGPAMRTCETAANQLVDLALRASRAGDLLRTRVDLALERQNQGLLESMNRRAHTQLRLQATVEGLSVAAITHYLVGLVGYLTKSLQKLGLPLDPDIVSGASILPIAGLVWLGVRRIRKSIDLPGKTER